MKHIYNEKLQIIAYGLAEMGIERTPSEIIDEIKSFAGLEVGEYVDHIAESPAAFGTFSEFFVKRPVVCGCCGSPTDGFEICTSCSVDQ